MLEFGDIIRKKREEKGWTQKELGEKLYVSNKAISRWENNQSYPDITLLLEIASVLDFDYQELIEGNQFIAKKKKRRSNVLWGLSAIIVILIGFMALGAYQQVQESTIHEQGIDFVVSKKWSNFGASDDSSFTVTYHITDYQKDEILSFLAIDEWQFVEQLPSDASPSFVQMSFDNIVDSSTNNKKIVHCTLYQSQENTYVYVRETNAYYQCPKDITEVYAKFKSTPQVQFDYDHEFENTTMLTLLSKEEAQTLHLLAQIGPTDSLFSFHHVTDYDNHNKEYAYFTSQRIDLTNLAIEGNTLIVEGEKRLYTKPYILFFENNDVLIQRIIFNGQVVYDPNEDIFDLYNE